MCHQAQLPVNVSLWSDKYSLWRTLTQFSALEEAHLKVIGTWYHLRKTKSTGFQVLRSMAPYLTATRPHLGDFLHTFSWSLPLSVSSCTLSSWLCLPEAQTWCSRKASCLLLPNDCFQQLHRNSPRQRTVLSTPQHLATETSKQIV